MKLAVLFCLVICLSCKKDKNETKVFSRIQLESIKEPEFFLDSLGLGELFIENKISQIKRYKFGWDNYYYFDYYPGTKKLQSILYKPASHPQSCAWVLCEFFYKNNKIDKIEISSPSSGCWVVVKTYQFEYFPIGALKSIIQIDDYYINETFFAYDSIGRVGKIFQSSRYKNETTYRFSETIVKYDIAGNVSEVTFQPPNSNKITERLNYKYDIAINPFKGVYIPRAFFWPFGWYESYPSFLSQNVVSLTTQYNESISSPQSYPYIVKTNSDRIYQFYYFDQLISTIYYQ